MDEGRSQKWSLSTWMILAALALVPGAFATAFSSFEVVKAALLLVLVGLAMLAFGVDVLRKKSTAVTGVKVALVAYLFGAFALISAAWSPVPILGLVDAMKWTAMVGVFLLVVSPVGRAIRFNDFGLALGIGAIIVGASSVLDAVGLEVFTPVWNPSGATGAFDSHEFLVPYTAMVIPILSAGVIRHTGWQKIVIGVGLLFAALGFGLNTSLLFAGVASGVWVVATLVILIFQGFGRASLLGPAVGALIVASSAAAVGHFLAPEPHASDANRLPVVVVEQKSTIDDFTDNDIRFPMFEIGRTEEVANTAAYPYLFALGMDMFREKPLGGQGAGGWWQVQTKYSRPDDPYVSKLFQHYPAFKSAHNSYVEALAGFGFIGFFLFLAWLVSVFAVTLTGLGRKEERERWLLEHWGLILGVGSGAALAMVSPALNFAGTGVVFFAGLGLLIRESSMLNEFKGLGTIWRIDANSGITTRVFVGLVPAVIGVAMVAVMVPNIRSEYYRGLADHLMLRTHFKRSADMYDKAHQAFPYRGENLFNKGLALRRTGKLDDGIEAMIASLELRPFDSRPHVHISQYYSLKNKPVDALKHARRSVELFRNNLEGRKAIALAFDREGRVEEAALEIQKALELDPPDTERAVLHQELGRYYEKDLGKPKLAIEHYQAAAKLTVDKVDREMLEFQVKELDKQVQRDRLQREGKPIPKDLMPAQSPSHDHGHGPEGHGGPGHGALPVPARPKGLPTPEELKAGPRAPATDSHEHEGHEH